MPGVPKGIGPRPVNDGRDHGPHFRNEGQTGQGTSGVNDDLPRDYVYVGDVVHANMLATQMELEEGLPIPEIETGVETSVDDLLRQLRETAEMDVRWRHAARGAK